ncbi:MAG: FAD-dependent oxidoreductase [Armatimonadetes bacterium CG_4_10_14_3_um_filter_66_18]|nr:FAD-dependent oxidoreductase [Armatimonadota bacterium]OIO92913.1 MAG: hypothetical protein AUJ96_31390 [Armatimonadetes bacterium CG2_30_66_41]PIU94521.1 MAG: FAD-dependent oxidoreductase [Armatimonadetes bacterium CG06_land_8_20_14_3_00_66_21]PIX44089.1 MAG: FAD-dependent oxidoreductase [Armatimonadetes bacterium CG_4_8_14_3_um_filter_66_20]PIY39359.1 MAG: FAD-dependent oxidoreductase [Armatimonadetes bacterium CG_4_10_14_3_um_filter_66_18]PIZ51044.1 MAG: FAD-dependent oxidoreductase [Arm
MGYLTEPAREVPVVHTCDLCVVGGSCTGVFAAVRAAQLGAEVCVVESNGFFGGVATAGLVNIWHSLLDTRNERQLIGGLTAEVVERLKKRGGVVEHTPTASSHFVLNTAELILELDALVMEHHICPFLHARFVQPVVDDGRVVAAIIEDKTGRRAIRARLFIDATGDGDLLVRAGFPFRKLEDVQPPTMCFHLHGLDEIRRQNPGFDLAKVVHDPQYPEALRQGLLWHAAVAGVPDLTLVAGTRAHNADCSDADQLTQASLETRRQVRSMCDLLRRHLPGGESVALAAIAAQIGIRETRHAQCLHTLTEAEVLHGVRFDDAIANGTYRVDVHHSGKAGLTFRYLDGREDYCAPGQPTQSGRWRPIQDEDPTFYQIPYRSLVPQGASNLLVAGRLVDADRGAYGAVRVMVNCNQTGEAAGAAAALALRENGGVAEVNAVKLRQTLSDIGAIIL